MKRTSIRQTTRNFTIILAGLMLCVSILSAQTATRQRLTQSAASPQEPQQKPKTPSNVDPLGILNTPEPPKTLVNAPAVNKPNATPQAPKNTTTSSSLDTVLSSNGIVASWVPGNGAAIPPNAVVAGNENGTLLYTCRVREKQNWVMLGKVVGEGCNYGFGKEKVSKQFEVLVGGGNWRQPTNNFAGAFDGGPDYNGEPRYLCRAPYQGSLHPGRLIPSGCYISYGGKAFSVTEYEVFYPSAGTLASNSSSSAPANQRVTSSSLDSMLGGSPAALSVALNNTWGFFLTPRIKGWTSYIYDANSLFHLIDLNGGELESGDLVSFKYQPTGQSVFIVQEKNERILALGNSASGEPAKFKLLKLVKSNGQNLETKGVIKSNDLVALQTSDGQYVKITGWNSHQKIEAADKFGKGESYNLVIFKDDAEGLTVAQGNVEALQQEQEKREARKNAVLNGIERMKSDAQQERIRQTQEAQAIAAQKEAAREEEAKQAEARRQIEEFRNAEAEAKRQRDEQAARAAAERQAAEQRAAEARLQQALSTPPSLFFPRPGETLRNGYSNHSASVTTAFTWSEVPSATAYQLYAKHSSAANPAINETVRVPQFSRTDTSYVADHFRIGWTWKVRAFINGQWGAWSEERALQYEPMNANPACRQ